MSNRGGNPVSFILQIHYHDDQGMLVAKGY
jgi:hypothetical protein